MLLRVRGVVCVCNNRTSCSLITRDGAPAGRRRWKPAGFRLLFMPWLLSALG